MSSSPYLYAFSLFLIAAVAISMLLLAGLQRRGQRGMRSFMFLSLCLAIWSAGYGMELLLPTLPAKMIWIQVEYLGIAFIPTATLLFVLSYTGRDNLTQPVFIALLSVIPLITIGLVLTSGSHDLFYQAVALDNAVGWPNFAPTYSIGFWVNLVYGYLELAIAVGLLAVRLWRSGRLYRRQNMLLIVGALAPWLSNLVYVSGLDPFPGLDLTPYGFSVTLLVLGFALIRLNLLDVMPAANDLVVENMRDPVFVLDQRSRVIGVNAAARQLIAPASGGLIGQPLVDLLPEAGPILKAQASQDAGQIELRRSDKGQQKVYALSLSEIRSRRGREIGRVFVLYDITEQKDTEQLLAQARDQALQAAELKSRMVAVVSHDFRTPLSAVVGYAELLKEGHYGTLDPDQQATVVRVLERTQQLTRLVNDLLDQSQMESGSLTVRTEAVRIAELAQIIEDSFRDRAQHKGLKFNLSVDEKLPPVLQTDRERLIQVISNLAGNAIKFTDEGSVTVRFCLADAAHWTCEVVDTGIGLTAAHQDRVFDPFWQAPSTAHLARGGIGLGLSIVRELVTLMEGQVTVESEPGEGARFVVTFPLPNPQ